MLRQRTYVVVLLLPVLLFLILRGGWAFSLTIALALSLGALEYARMFRGRDLRPAQPILIAGVASLAIARQAFGFAFTPLLLAGWCLLSLTWHLVDYERGAGRSATDFNVTLAGIVYLGWVGAYLISLRNLPGGEWWVLLTLPSVWLADSAAYFVGKARGRHKFTPRLSPNKTWEGYLAGVLTAVLAGAGLAWLWMTVPAEPPEGLSLAIGVVIGAAVGILSPLGDLGISMLKRELNVKDTGGILPGHGGILDRMDSWLWAGVIGFYLASWFAPAG